MMTLDITWNTIYLTKNRCFPVVLNGRAGIYQKTKKMKPKKNTCHKITDNFWIQHYTNGSYAYQRENGTWRNISIGQRIKDAKTWQDYQSIYDEVEDLDLRDKLADLIEELRDKELELKSVYVPNMEDYQ